MSRVHQEPVEVQLRDGKPERFVWRGRLYTVLAVLAHWTARRVGPQDPGSEPLARHEFWRVEASPGKNVPGGVFELRHDVVAGRWLLTRRRG